MAAPSASPAGPGPAVSAAAGADREATSAAQAPAPQAALRLPPAEDVGPGGLVSVVIPAKNEEAGIGATLRGLPLATLGAMGYRTELLVLDGDSRDRTRAIARGWGARVVEQQLPGKGNALRLAKHLVRGEFVVMLDADHTYPADVIPAMVTELARGADIVMGSRMRGWVAPGAMGPVNRAGNRMLSLLASALYMRRCSDVCTGMWGFRGDAFRSLPLVSQGFELEVEMFGLAARSGYRVVELPVDYLPRHGPTKLSKVRDGVRIGWWLLRTRFARGPHRRRRRPPRRHAGKRGRVRTETGSG